MYRTLKQYSLLFMVLLLGMIAAGLIYLSNTNLMGAADPVRSTPRPTATDTAVPAAPSDTAAPPTPEATLTPTASATLSASPPPATALPEATHTPIAANGTLIETLPDGATRFTDLTGGYTLTFPTGWALIRINQEEFTRLALNEALGDEALQRLLISLQQRDPNTFRVFALNMEMRQPGNDQITIIEVRLDTQETLSVDQLRARYYQFIKAEYTLDQMLTNDMVRNSHNTRAGLVEAVVQARAATGQPVNQYIKTLLLTPHNRQQLRISLFALEAFRQQAGPVIEQIFETYATLNP